MPYEIDFLPVGEGRSGDAIAIRYAVNDGYEVMVVDGGTEQAGNDLVQHIRKYYGTNHVHHVISTHPDNDHASGLRPVLESLIVDTLWVHVPWAHAELTHRMVQNEWTTDRLKVAIRHGYPIIDELVTHALENGTRVAYPFQGEHIGPFLVAAPTLTRYNKLLPQFRDTPAPNEPLLRMLGEWMTGLGKRAAKAIRKVVLEKRDLETLRDGGITSAENESSVVLYGDFPNDPKSVLLTADAGLQALREAIDYLVSLNIDLNRLGLIQVPHHGSRNNISPAILNRLIGPPIAEGQTRGISAIASASLDDEDHPRQIVANAFDRRGVTVYPTHGQAIRHHRNMPPRAGWERPVTPMPFAPRVEEYD